MQGGPERIWSEDTWHRFDAQTRARALDRRDSEGAWREVVRASREIMRSYTTGFFIASRFLPRIRRDAVEAVYAAVRFPDEIVDTFPLEPDARDRRIDAWAGAYERAGDRDLRENLADGIPCFLAGFAEVMRRTGLPAEHYRSFLDAMRLDIRPVPFPTLDELIARYVHGSAIVVGYFLAYIYGAVSTDAFPRALAASRDLGIALQLTNFARDVAEDHRRGRCYLPLDYLRDEGIERMDPADPAQHEGIGRAVRRLAADANRFYAEAAAGIDAFAPDCRTAIRTCMEVYGRLNRRICEQGGRVGHRERIPGPEKWKALPPSKYWRIPWAYLERRIRVTP